MAHDWSLQTTQRLKQDIRQWGRELGFSAVGFAPADPLGDDGYRQWLAAGYHGGMDYMARNQDKRTRPAELVPGTRAIVSVRMDYAPADLPEAAPDTAVISRYALGRDYHKVMRNRLQKLAERIEQAVGPYGYRAFTDSAPVMEVELAGLAGLGWRGKHTLLLSRTGSWYFLGELYTDLPHVLDARRCISYLTIEHAGSIPEDMRPLMGTRIYGCDDCQVACPWNRFATPSREADFQPRHGLDQARLTELLAWSEADFDGRLAGSPIRRIGFERWLRNIAVALGNAPPSAAALAALAARAEHPSPLVREHVAWAMARLGARP